MPHPKVIQIEVTTRCQLRCGFCPRTVLAPQWISRDLSAEDFRLVLAWLRGGEMVHLQGWGEPLLHPNVLDMAREVKARGCWVSLTTNGMLLDHLCIDEICICGLDLVAVSVAGATSRTHDALRRGSRLETILGNLTSLLARPDRPRVHLVMHLMRENLEELPALVDLASGLGVDKVVVSHLDYAPSPEVAVRQVFGMEDQHLTEGALGEARRTAHTKGVDLHLPSAVLGDRLLMCDARPTDGIWITVLGEIAPCPYLCLPVEGAIPRVACRVMEHMERFSYGTIQQGLKRVLRGSRAREFMGAYKRRLLWDRLRALQGADLSSVPKGAGGMLSLISSWRKLVHGRIPDEMPLAPDPCQGCPKLWGI